MFGKNANNKGAEATDKRISSKMVKMNRKNMKYVISIAICLLFIATALSSAVGETVNVNKNQDWNHIIENKESPDKCAFSDKGDNLDNWAITPSINLSGIAAAKLKFETKYEIVEYMPGIASNSTGFGYVKMSSDGGATWSTLAALQGSQPDWIEMEIYMDIYPSPWAGEIILIAFEYSTGPDSLSEGWYVDDIVVEGDGVILHSEDFEEYEVGEKWGDWIIAGKAPIDIEEITIGTGQDCFSFAIFADPQSSGSKLQEAVTWINNHASSQNIKFVKVLGDIIQGEKGSELGYRTEYTNTANTGMKDILDKLGDGNPTNGVEIPYIPMIGNHEPWCNLDGNPLPSTTIPRYTDYPGGSGVAPEQIFDEIFGPVYAQLATTLPGWTKQDENMPITNPNPHVPPYPPIYFQNFAFEFGPYHFICLDFCSRKDFDDIVQHTIMGPIFGYADLHDFTTNNGTYNWLDTHLAGLSSQQKQNIILFTHHPLIYKLQILFTLDGDNTFCFDELIEGEYTKLKDLLNSHGCSVIHCFSGHYHLKGSNWGDGKNIIWWHDANIGTAGSDISIIPSTMICSEFGGQSIPPHTSGTINGVYSGRFEPNPNGTIAIVNVKADSSEILPDPFISTVIGDNPDVDLYIPQGSHDYRNDNVVPYSSDLDPDRDYQIRVKLHNGGCRDANINVAFYWAGFGIGFARDKWRDDAFNSSDPSGYPHLSDAVPPNPNGEYTPLNDINHTTTHPLTISPGEVKEVYILLNTSKIKEAATLEHGCIFVEIEPLNGDIRDYNNLAQENIDVDITKSAEIGKCKEIPIPVYNPTNISNGVILEVTPTKGRLWNATIMLPPDGIPPESWGTAYLVLCPILLDPIQPFEVGDVENFRVTGRRADTGELIGGVEIASLIDDLPILEWAGNNGYASDGVEPDEGNPGDTFTFRVNYTDKNNHRPASGYPIVYLSKGDKQIKGSPFVMNEEDASDTDYTDGKNYFCPITLTEEGNDYTYYFWARDKLGIGATGPATQIKEGPIVKEVPIPLTSLKEFFVTGDPNGNVYIYWSNNDGTFIRSKIGDVTNSGTTPGSCAGAAIADYDHDGDLDVFMGNRDTDAIYLFTNIGSGNFAPPILCTTIPAPLGMDATIADFDNNGDYDYIAVGSNRRDIYIVPNIAPDGPNPTLIWTCGSGHVIDGIDAGDFNEDGKMDFLVVEYWTGSGNEVRLFEGRGDGTFKNPVVAFTAPAAATDGLPAVAVGDFNRDGHLDAIYGHDDGGDPGQAWLYLGDGNGNFAYGGEAYDVNPTESGANQPGGGLIDAFDFNKDGYLDIVATCCWSGHADDPVKGVYYIPENTPPLPPYFNDPTEPMDPSSIAKRMHAIAAPPLDGRWLVNPGWRIFLNSAGYSDILYCTPPAPYIEYEILSGEWAAALKYDDITNTGLDPTNPFGAQWLTQEFIYPGWPTGSPFKVIEPICTRDNPYNPIAGPDTGHSAIANDQVRIDIEYSMVETSEGTPMGMNPDPASGSFVMSSKHVMLQRYTIKNIGDQTLNNFKFFQFLHAHPKGYGCPEILYDSERYRPIRPFAGYHNDITLWRQFGTGPHPEATECIGFSSDEPPDYYGLGIYDGHDHGKPDIGLHWHIESADELPGNTHLSDLPAQNRLAGAEGWVLGRLEPNELVSVRTLLAIHNPLLDAAPDYVDSWTKINKELDELIAKVNAATVPSINKRILVDLLEHAKTSVENAKIAHEAGNDAQAKKYLGVAKNQIESFEHMVEITRKIKPEDKEIFLRESAKIKEKMDALIESL